MLPGSGSISLSQVNVELGSPRTATSNINMNDPAVRTLAQVGGSGTAYSMNNLRGKSAYTPMSASGVNDSRTYDSTFSASTAYAYPSVNVSAGSGGYTFAWTITSQAGTTNGILSNSTSQTCQLYANFGRNAFGHFDTNLTCVITDNTGHTVTITGINGYADWANNM